ncbi:diaminopimelate decarboxylase [Candidatus Cyanaurora vandensis]|uniref:diaminopimelate decarboxylase n=1 Tax=Candidatus Cyanaurora vandensis TaxID=2714958 RepID=UPI0025795F9A|nr:diaminopimelate decarboxylase [Candidatus Cyanaurora vandensis]
MAPNQQIRPLTACVNAQGHLAIGGIDTVTLAGQWGTPLYVVDELTLRTACREYVQALATAYPGAALAIYASKAWNILALCALVRQEGLGIDVVSAGELAGALQAGVAADKIYFHGNNKSEAELTLALTAGVTIVVDNWFELKTLARLGPQLSYIPRLLVRVTPGIECHTHEYIQTGHLDSKFGFDPNEIGDLFSYLVDQPGLHCVGLHAHIGSQIFELQPHQDLAQVLVDLYAKGLHQGLPFCELNVGGGLGVCYVAGDDPPAIAAWVEAVAGSVARACARAGLDYPKLICEPGRSLIANSCLTLYQVGSTKTVPGVRTYIAVDGGMSDNPRPITYGARYTALIANKADQAADQLVTVAGKHCESGDILLKDVLLAQPESGDLLTVFTTGAYNYAMASNYNRVPRPAAVLVNEGEASLILQRETTADLLRQDCLPPRLMGMPE